MIGRLRRRRPGVWFVVAGVLAVLAALVTMRAAAGTAKRTSAILVAAEPISVGSRIDRIPGALARVQIPFDTVLPGMVRDPEEVRGRLVAVPVGPGEPITQAVLGGDPSRAPEPLAPGQRAVSVPLSAAGAAAAALVPGARVDVVASDAGGSGREARVVVAAAEVIGTSMTSESDVIASPAGAALLRVSAKDALALSAALDLAQGVRILPRSAGEEISDAVP